MNIIRSFILILLLGAGTVQALGQMDRFSRDITLSYPDELGNVAYKVKIKVVPVHPNVAIHYFKDEPYMFLQHGKDSQEGKYYQSILYPIIGMKTYVTPFNMSGPILPVSLLDKNSQEILSLQISEIKRYGGVENYVKMLEKRGWFAP